MLVDKNAPISKSMQRWFGLSLAALVAIITLGLRNVHPWVGPLGLSAATAVAFTYYIWTNSQIPIIRGWQTLTFPIGFIAGHVLLGSIYLLIAVPIGLTMRLLHYDPLRLRTERDDANGNTNWQDRPAQPPTVDQYFKQY